MLWITFHNTSTNKSLTHSPFSVDKRLVSRSLQALQSFTLPGKYGSSGWRGVEWGLVTFSFLKVPYLRNDLILTCCVISLMRAQRLSTLQWDGREKFYEAPRKVTHSLSSLQQCRRFPLTFSKPDFLYKLWKSSEGELYGYVTESDNLTRVILLVCYAQYQTISTTWGLHNWDCMYPLIVGLRTSCTSWRWMPNLILGNDGPTRPSVTVYMIHLIYSFSPRSTISSSCPTAHSFPTASALVCFFFPSWLRKSLAYLGFCYTST